MSAVMPDPVVYPESDGQPLGEGTRQIRWIINLYNWFQALFYRRPDVFVAADLFWYPVEGSPAIVTAPDVMVVFGRPTGDRGNYRQWEEGNVPPQVVFEIFSPWNRQVEMQTKFRFYRQYGVQEYYVYDPDPDVLSVWVRAGRRLEWVRNPDGWTSPRLGVRFDAPGGRPMRVLRPDGTPFLTYAELIARAEAEAARAEAERRRADALAAKLRALGIDPDAV